MKREECDKKILDECPEGSPERRCLEAIMTGMDDFLHAVRSREIKEGLKARKKEEAKKI